MNEPACWSWPVTDEDRNAVRECPENFAHILLWNWQRGHCAFCGAKVGDGVRLRRDHDHTTKLSRGLLCSRCNALEGRALRYGQPGAGAIDPHHPGQTRDYGPWRHKNAHLIEMMVMYRNVNPASKLGLRARHEYTVGPWGILLPLEYRGPLPLPKRPDPPAGE